MSFHPLRFSTSFASSKGVYSMKLMCSIYIWGNDGNDLEIDPSERTRWLGKIMAIRAAAKDKVFM